jgi:hypothetical protein
VTATAADVAYMTNRGVRLTSPDQITADAIKAAHFDARDMGTSEIEMFFPDPAHGQAFLDEKAALLTQVDPLHEGIEVEDSLGIGNAIAVVPIVPSVAIVDGERDISGTCRVRAYVTDMASDRYSLEVVA